MANNSELVQNTNLYEKNYEINSFLTNTRGQLGLYALLNVLQDISHYHANLLGFGYEDMVAQQIFWVLTRQKLTMTKWPKWHEHIKVQTWIRQGAAAFTNRDFAIYLNNQKIGEATTSWMTMDAKTRRPKSIDYKDLFSNINSENKITVAAEKHLPLATDITTLTDFKVRNSDIDQNNHVNNTKYAKWILDAIPFEMHHQHELTSYSINFLAETKLNDTVTIQKGPKQKEIETAFETQFQGLREADSKIVFTANLGAKLL